MTSSIGQGNLCTGPNQQEAACNHPGKKNTRALSSKTGSNRFTSVQHMAQPLHSPTHHRSTSARGKSRAQRQQMTIPLKPRFPPSSLLALDYRDQRKQEEGWLQPQHLLRETDRARLCQQNSPCPSVRRRFADTRASGIRAAANICLSALYGG